MQHEGRQRKILCVHQGYELYGSDKVFLRTVEQIKVAFPDALITIHLPQDSSLADKIRETNLATNIIFGDMWVLRKANLKLKNIGRLPSAIACVFKARARMKDYDHVFINTIVVIDYILAAMFSKISPVIHVHELVRGFTALVFSWLFRLSGSRTVFISPEVRDSLCFTWFKDHALVVNGCEDLSKKVDKETRLKYERSDDENKLNLLVVGRISENKGQRIAVEAVGLVRKQYPEMKIALRILGGVFEQQTHFLEAVKAALKNQGTGQLVELHNFNSNILEYYLWSDIVLVPTQNEEPFGLVAIEAMSLSKPVVATESGGLKSIVVDQETGIKARTGSPGWLASAIGYYIDNPQKKEEHGRKGYDRYKTFYTIEGYNQNIRRTLMDWWMDE